MPTYVYRFVDTDETVEIQQSFSDPTLTEAVHPATGATMPVKKVFQPVGVTFKGDGFYKTDSRSGKKSASVAPGSSDASGGASSSTESSTTSSTDSSSSGTSDSKSSPSESSKTPAPKAAPAASGSSST